jgi:hypothetical protein
MHSRAFYVEHLYCTIQPLSRCRTNLIESVHSQWGVASFSRIVKKGFSLLKAYSTLSVPLYDLRIGGLSIILMVNAWIPVACSGGLDINGGAGK